MYIKVNRWGYAWQYTVRAGNHRVVCHAASYWDEKSPAVRAAKKMAKKLNIEYREN